jgi:hypothetical protein
MKVMLCLEPGRVGAPGFYFAFLDLPHNKCCMNIASLKRLTRNAARLAGTAVFRSSSRVRRTGHATGLVTPSSVTGGWPAMNDSVFAWPELAHVNTPFKEPSC